MSDDATPVAALELRGIHKRFADVVALDGAGLLVRSGTVHALLGENGAGKSTLMRIAHGLTAPDAGEVRVHGARVRSVRDAMRAGAGMVHQHLSLVPALTAAENLALGGRGRLHPARLRDALQRAIDAFGLVVPPDALARDLSIVEQQRLEILKALTRGARLLILDEPTAVLAPADARELMQWIRGFVASGGSVVLVTHKLREALDVAGHLTVLRRGQVVYSGAAADTSEAELARLIFPDAPRTAIEPASSSETGSARERPVLGAVVVRAVGLRVTDARGARRIRDASFELRAGEIVGIAAVEGSGQRELLRLLAGLQAPFAGELVAPREVALIPADRAREGLIPDFSLAENVALHDAGSRRGLLRWRTVVERTGHIIRRFGIVAPSAYVPARSLSGGNQQRLVVGRELEHSKPLIVADNPTRGLDLRATSFVYEQLRGAAANGALVILHASDLDDVLAIATRVLVVFHGHVREVGLDRDAIGRAMLGAGAA